MTISCSPPCKSETFAETETSAPVSGKAYGEISFLPFTRQPVRAVTRTGIDDVASAK